MYAHLFGKVDEKRLNELTLDVSGVGYLLQCSQQTLQVAPATGQSMKVFTHLSVREDALELFGFATREERAMFRRLVAVTGIGSRTALGILSTLSLQALTLALLTSDANTIAKAPNVGKKTAQRLILELKDKLGQAEIETVGISPSGIPGDAQSEAIEALISLGYSASEANRAVAMVASRADKADALILLALKGLGA